jgi:hypothetical protein
MSECNVKAIKQIKVIKQAMMPALDKASKLITLVNAFSRSNTSGKM